MNTLRLERALLLLRNVNELRLRRRDGGAALVWAEQALLAFDDACRARIDARQLSIYDAMHPP